LNNVSGIGAVLCSFTLNSSKGSNESFLTCSVAFNLDVDGSETDTVLVMVVAADVGHGHWVFYAVSYIVNCTAWGVS